MMRNYVKTQIDVIGLEDVLNRLTNTYHVKIEALPEPLKLNDGEIVDKRVYFTVPRKEGEDASSPRVHFIGDLAALFLADMVRAQKCFVGRW